jgi:hypothetical protein
MGTSLAEFVSNTTFVNGQKPATNIIAHAPVNHILDFCRESIELTKAKDLAPETSIFTHSASISLGGGRYPCMALDCRLKHVNELAQFAALYSEKVYIKNLFSDHLEHIDEKGPIKETALKQSFADDLQIYIHLMPLIEAGIITPITPPYYCSHCLLKKNFGDNAKNRMAKAFKDLATLIRNDIRISINRDHGIYLINIDGSDKTLEHTGVMAINKMPPFLKSHPRLLAQVKAGKSITLSTQLLRDSEVSEYLASELMESIIFELTLSQCLNTSFLTNREVDRDFLRFLTTNRQVRELDGLIEKNLTALVPFLKNITPSALIQLRKGDEDSFILFRKTMRKIVAEYTSNSGMNHSQDDARAIYGDILQPELARLTKKLEKAQKTFVRSAGSTIVGWTAAISVGAFTGFVTGGIAKAAAALGLTKVMANMMEKAGRNSDTQAAIRDEDLYFLWKVKRKSEQ